MNYMEYMTKQHHVLLNKCNLTCSTDFMNFHLTAPCVSKLDKFWSSYRMAGLGNVSASSNL
jgi:hypothetical protein